jgi:Membrane protein involved in the export of O-antigen and teichoic acid
MGVIIRQSVKGTAVTYVGAFIGFLTTLYIIPKFIGEETFGLTRVILDAAVLFSAIFIMGASHSAIRYFPYFKSEDKKNNGFFFYLIALVTLGSVLFIPVFFLLKEPISHYFSQNSPQFVHYLYWVIPLTLFLIYWLTFEVYSNILMRIAVPKFIREILLRLLVIAVYLAYGFGWINLDTFIAAFVGVYGIVMLVTFVYVSRIGPVSLRHDRSFITPALKNDFLSYAPIVVLGALGGTLVGVIDTFMISGMEGLNWTGIYKYAYYMIMVVEIPSRSITSISSPVVSHVMKEKNYKEANRLYKDVSLHQLLAGSAIFSLIWINIENIYAIIPHGEVYRDGIWVVLFIGLAKLVEVSISFGGVMIGYSRYFRWNLFFAFFISGIAIVLNLLLIPRLGISGAAIATLAACVVAYSFQLGLVYIKLKAMPFSAGTLKLLLVIVVTFLLSHFLPSLSNPYVDILYRSLLCGGLFLLLTYVLKISEQMNGIVKKLRK